MNKILLDNKVVQNVIGAKEIENLSGSVNIMMGQTFDYGQPIDMMKYAFYIMGLQDSLNEKGVKANSVWLLADHFISDINRDAETEIVRKQALERINYLESLNITFNGDINVVLSSEISRSKDYQYNLEILKTLADEDTTFRSMVLNAVPLDRRDNPKAIEYPLEELATIQSCNANIKVGPIYEKFYDQPAREFSDFVGFSYSAIHLTNCYPFGNPELTSEIRKEIESFGVLPYKIGSKGLGDFRIDPVNDSLEKSERLISESSDIRALSDLAYIVNSARIRTEGKHFFSYDEISEGFDERIGYLKERLKEGYAMHLKSKLTGVKNGS